MNTLRQRVDQLETAIAEEREPLRPTRKFGGSTRLSPSPEKIHDLEETLSLRLEEERRAHLKKELATIQKHYDSSREDITSIGKLIVFTIKWVEQNSLKLSLLMGTRVTGEFKRNLAVSMMKLEESHSLDEDIVNDLVAEFVNVLYPHMVKPVPIQTPTKHTRGFFKRSK